MSINAIVPEAGELQFLQYLIDAVLNGSYQKLFKNNVTITSTTVLTDLDECDFAGYDAFVLTSWSTPVVEGDGSAGSSPGPAIFSCTDVSGSGTIYGGYVVDPTLTYLLWAFNFPSPYIVLPNGVSLSLTPLFTVISRY